MFIQGKILSGTDDLKEAYEIRRKVFIEEYGILENEEFDKLDSTSMHVIVYEDNEYKKAVATGRIYYDGETCEIGKICVLKEFRNRKYGDFAVRMLLNKAFTSGISDVYLNAEEQVVEFYKKIGFEIIGSEFKEADIIHRKMIINIRNIATTCNKCNKI
ncbi:MAG: GNAT family N-acetyltransferase [Mobilitalea sp.]